MPFLILFFILIPSIQAQAAPLGPETMLPTGSKESGLDLLEKADRSQKILSEQLHKLSHSLDSFFGSARIDEESKSDSRIRINLISSFRDYSGDSYGANFRSRIALPRTERRLNIVLQNVSRSFDEDKEGSQPSLGETLQNEDYAAGLRYLPEISKEWNLGVDTGVKLVLPPDPFIRLRGRRSWWPGLWEIRATGTLFWFNSRGFGHTESLEFDRQISDSLLFRSENTASWLNVDNEYQFSQSLNFIQRLNDEWGLLYFLRMSGSNDPVPHAEAYSSGINFRKRIKGNWFYFNIQPAGNWPRERDFLFVASLDLKVEVIIGE
ncbi:MAG: hypothetical protein KDD35_12415 [Bdellovibrionales bacterium]|nr:hypothetical protein [Bdellovibrionales bacterium]